MRFPVVQSKLAKLSNLSKPSNRSKPSNWSKWSNSSKLSKPSKWSKWSKSSKPSKPSKPAKFNRAFALLALLFLALAPALAEETHRGTVRRPLFVTCGGGCDDLYLEPDTGVGNINLANPAGSSYLTGAYVDQHVEVTGFVSSCNGCMPLFVTHPITIIPTGVADLPSTPARFALRQNFPNPFNPSTRIEVELPEAGELLVVIADVVGRSVGTIAPGWKPAGIQTIDWSADGLSGGVYYATVRFTPSRGLPVRRTLPMLLLR